MLTSIIIVALMAGFAAIMVFANTYCKNIIEDVDTKAKDFASWYTEDARKDVELYIREKKGAQIKKRILIETFKKNVSNPKFADIMANTKALMPPDAILGNLAYVTLPIAA